MGQFEIEIGYLIKQERLRQKLSREKLSEMADIDNVFLYKIETGKRGMSLKTFCKILHALNISLDDFLEWEKEDIHKIIDSLLFADD